MHDLDQQRLKKALPTSAVLLGRRLAFRPMVASDVDGGWLNWINAVEHRQFLDAPINQTREDLLAYLDAGRKAGDAFFAVIRRSDGVHIGNARLSSISRAHQSAVYGRLLGEMSARRQGFGTEMLALLFEYGFTVLGLNRLSTGVIAENTPSIASNQRLGVTQEGVSRDARRLGGRFVDVVQFGILAAEYHHLRPQIRERFLDPGSPAEWVSDAAKSAT